MDKSDVKYQMGNALGEMLGAIESLTKALDSKIYFTVQHGGQAIESNNLRKRLFDLQVDIRRLQYWNDH